MVQCRRRVQPGPMSREFITRRHGELSVPKGDKTDTKLLATSMEQMFLKPHLFDQAILKRLIGPFDPPLCLRCQRGVRPSSRAAAGDPRGVERGGLATMLRPLPAQCAGIICHARPLAGATLDLQPAGDMQRMLCCRGQIGLNFVAQLLSRDFAIWKGSVSFVWITHQSVT